jgi:tetratricopeptide (TPR) repeat protein
VASLPPTQADAAEPPIFGDLPSPEKFQEVTGIGVIIAEPLALAGTSTPCFDDCMVVFSLIPLFGRLGMVCFLGLALLVACTEVGSVQAADPPRAISKEPSDANGYYARGTARARNGEFKEAIADFDHALELDPSLDAAYRNRAFAKKNMGDFAGAIEDATQAILLDPDDADAASTRGEARLASDDLDGAISDFSRAISRDPGKATYYLNRAIARDAKGSAASTAAAMTDFKRAIDLDPNFVAAYVKRAESNIRHHDLDRAMGDLDRAIAIDPNDVHARAARREVRLVKAEPKGALEDATRLVELDPKNPVAYSNRGLIWMLLRQWPEALEDYRRDIALSTSPNDDDHLYVWLLRTRLGEMNAANEELARYLTTRPAAKVSDWYASAAGFLLGKVSEEQLLAASTAPERFEALRLQSKAWYYIGMKKLFVTEKGAIESLARCFSDEQHMVRDRQVFTPEIQLAIRELAAVGRPPREAPAETMERFIKDIPFKNAYSFQSDEHSVSLLSKKARDDQPVFQPEAFLDFYGPKPWNSGPSIEDHLRDQVAEIRKLFQIAPYIEKDHPPTENIVSFVETIGGVQVGFIKYRVNRPDFPVPPSSVNAVILKDRKQYTFTLATFVPETQENYRQDLRLLIETLIKNGRL